MRLVVSWLAVFSCVAPATLGCSGFAASVASEDGGPDAAAPPERDGAAASDDGSGGGTPADGGGVPVTGGGPDAAVAEDAPTNDIAAYAGTYVGTYSGQDSGTITLTVSTTGIIALAAHSYFWGDFAGSGALSPDGAATASGTGAGKGVTFTFQGTFVPGAATGSWSTSNNATGTWTATRQ